jgi:hypothetical protein
MEKRFAELIGILLGDGHIANYNRSKRVKVTLHSEERDYCFYVSNLMETCLGVCPKIIFSKKENVVNIQICRKEVVDFLLSIGMISSPKRNRAKIPDQYYNKKFGKFVLRGLFDTDGCLALVNNNGYLYPRVEIKVCPSPMQLQIFSLLDLYGFHYGKYDIGNGQVRIQINGKDNSKKWFEAIGSRNLKHLEKARAVKIVK